MTVQGTQPTPHEVTILIADDHAVVRDGLKRLLQDHSGLVVVAEAKDGKEAIAFARELKPDIVLLDIAMPQMDGIDVLRQLSSVSAESRAILLTAAATKWQIREALELGARGVVMKSSAVEMLVKSIRCVMAGEDWVDRATAADLLHSAGSRTAAVDSLTERERELIAEVAGGSGNRAIADKLCISEKTVKRHLVNIFDKLGVRSRLELAVFAMKNGLVPSTRVPDNK